MAYINTTFSLYKHYGLNGANEVLKNLTPSQFDTLAERVQQIWNDSLEKGYKPNTEFIDEYIMNLRVWKHAPVRIFGDTWKNIVWDNYRANELMEWNGMSWTSCPNWRNARARRILDRMATNLEPTPEYESYRM